MYVFSGGWTGMVATCGGRAICLVDCSTGRVMKKFHQNKGVSFDNEQVIYLITYLS